MKVCVEPVPSTLSQAMHRVARALRKSAPGDLTIVKNPEEADLQVLHMIGRNCMEYLRAPHYAVIQYCGNAEHANGFNVEVSPSAWTEIWTGASLVWSYYNLPVPPSVNYYHAPLGVDSEVFTLPEPGVPRDLVFTSGYVSGPGAEAIEEVAMAAAYCGLTVKHLGPPNVKGMDNYPSNWSSCLHIPDDLLVRTYQRSLWVSGLRHVEGFELPVLEGLACGARPIVFDRPDMREWYDGTAAFVPESSGSELISHLIELFGYIPKPVTPAERQYLLARFDWQTIGKGFWAQLGVTV